MKPVYFVIGTRAQFIKVAPLLRLIKDRGEEYILVYTAQHEETIDEILETYDLPAPDIILFKSNDSNTRAKFSSWFIRALVHMTIFNKRYLKEKGLVVTHGDTFTAWLAAIMGKLRRCKVAHLESGLRSFDIFNPFPEEISRLITFRFSDIYFCPNDWAVNNLKKYKGVKVNMLHNPMYDGVKFALTRAKRISFSFEKEPFAVVSIHRYENIFRPRFEEYIIPKLFEISQKIKLVITLHPTTRERLKSLGKYEELEKNPNIILHQRFNFVDWITVCDKAQFVISDGGSNQEELSYLGVPTLLFRNETERTEGLDRNVVLSKFDDNIIDHFIDNPDAYRYPFIEVKESPSEIVFDYIYGKGSYESKGNI